MKLNNIIKHYKETAKLRQMQYIQDQDGIARRYQREKQNWDLHFKSSKDFILKSAETKNKGKLIVLGSGWLFDLPINELSNQFKEIVLIDIIHPKQVLKKIKSFDNVTTIKADITDGLIDFFYNNVKQKNSLNITNLSSFSFDIPEADFVISLNIMCQLHIILIDYMKKFNKYSSSELNKIEQQIQQSHLNILPKGKTCLITDFEEEIYDEKEILIGVNPLIKVALPTENFMRKWQWKFDSNMTYREDSKTFFNTMALDF